MPRHPDPRIQAGARANVCGPPVRRCPIWERPGAPAKSELWQIRRGHDLDPELSSRRDQSARNAPGLLCPEPVRRLSGLAEESNGPERPLWVVAGSIQNAVEASIEQLGGELLGGGVVRSGRV